MNKAELKIITLVLGFAIPLMMFVLCWWVTAAFDVFNVVNLSDKIIAVVSLTGLGLGILGNILYLRKWSVSFYDTNIRLMMLIYLFCSLIAIAFFMGVPGGNLFLGGIAGLYIGRKYYHFREISDHFLNASRKASIFTALVIGAVAFPIGLLALNSGEKFIAEHVLRIVGLNYSTINGLALITLLCCVLMIIQYWITKIAALIGFRYTKI